MNNPYQCESCGAESLYVTDTDKIRDKNCIRRRKRCSMCGHRSTTYEICEEDFLKLTVRTDCMTKFKEIAKMVMETE